MIKRAFTILMCIFLLLTAVNGQAYNETNTYRQRFADMKKDISEKKTIKYGIMTVNAYHIEDNDDLTSSGDADNKANKTTNAVSIPHSDGEYSIEVSMTGGSGRANISSPALLIIKDGRAYARLIWSSPYYDYMIVDENVYNNLTTDGGNSVFEIPVTAMDTDIPVIADTTAMGEPLEIEYILTFYSDSIDVKGKIPQEAAKKVLGVAIFIIVAGGILNYFAKKKRK